MILPPLVFPDEWRQNFNLDFSVLEGKTSITMAEAEQAIDGNICRDQCFKIFSYL
jgi:hypothetical protein